MFHIYYQRYIWKNIVFVQCEHISIFARKFPITREKYVWQFKLSPNVASYRKWSIEDLARAIFIHYVKKYRLPLRIDPMTVTTKIHEFTYILFGHSIAVLAHSLYLDIFPFISYAPDCIYHGKYCRRPVYANIR